MQTRGLCDIKLLCPSEVEDRAMLGFSNTTRTSMTCYFNDGTVSYFIPNWEYDSANKAWNIDYTEYEWTNPPVNKITFNNNKKDFLESLHLIEELADKIECNDFANRFQAAIDWLEGHDTKYFENEKDKNLYPQIPNDNLVVYKAVEIADVFGAMGSWNDAPPYFAYKKGLTAEYDKCSNELLKNIRGSFKSLM